MSTGRTKPKWTRIYVEGRDMSGYARSVGPLSLEYEEADLTTWTDQVKGYLRNHASVNLGTLNTVFDNTASVSPHIRMQPSAGTSRTVLVAMGIRAVPAAGDPCFGGTFKQGGYQATEEGGAVTTTIPWQGWAADAATLLYAGPWGTLLHASGAETGANIGTGFGSLTGAATAKGGYFLYEIQSSNAAGTVTLSVDDSANNVDFAALAGATTTAIAFGSIPCAGIVALANNADVRQYLRWQLALAGGATTCTFVSAFMRAY